MKRLKPFLLFSIAAALLSGCQVWESNTNACARLAAHPHEQIMVGDESVGVAFEKIDKAAAIEMCRTALEEENKPSTMYHLARALLARSVSSSNAREAKDLLDKSLSNGYGFANLGLGYFHYAVQGGDGNKAFDYYMKASKFGAKEARYGAGYALLYHKDTASRREEGTMVLEKVAISNPNAYLTLGAYYSARSKKPDDWKRAEKYLIQASERSLVQANLELAKIYWNEQSPIRNFVKTRQFAMKAVEGGITAGYDYWVKSHYFGTGLMRNRPQALAVARKGAKAGDIYSAYVAGYMIANGQTTNKNSLEAEQYLLQAAKGGSTEAKKLLDGGISARAAQLRNLPSKNAQTCVSRRASGYDKNIVDYYNTCQLRLTAMICSRKVGTEIFSFFDGKDRESCRTRSVAANSFITNFYGADSDSSLLRMAISDTNVKVGVCYPPLMPSLKGNLVYCRE